MANPAEAMFKTFKRNHEIQINVVFKEKIGKPEFIKMMMDNMEGDIVGYYKKLIVDDIMNNFKTIEDEVEKQIKQEIFGLTEEQTVDIQSSINKIMELSKKIVDKSDEISFNGKLDDEVEKNTTVDDFEEELVHKLTEEELKNMTEFLSLIPGGLTSSGKQLFKYVDENGKIKEVLPGTAERNGWKPLTK
jgi:polyhydroxyalkanoate synthesis regulator phasin